jgi:transcriptional regulator GlxA family with amidase domain
MTYIPRILPTRYATIKAPPYRFHGLQGSLAPRPRRPPGSFPRGRRLLSVRDRRPAYECTVVSTRGGRVMTADGVELTTASTRSFAKKAIDTLVVPGGFQVDDVIRDRALVRWIAKIAPECKRVCSVCVGSFLLAEAGILDGRRAATHWMHAPLLANSYPAVKVEPDAIFVRDGRVWSSAGVTSGIDLALALIEQDLGRKVSIEVARMLVVYLKRAGGQSQYSALLAAQAQSDVSTGIKQPHFHRFCCWEEKPTARTWYPLYNSF